MSQTNYFSILAARKKTYYRVLEGFIGFSSLAFLIFLFVLSALMPTLAALFLILYGLVWFLKVTLTCIYTLFSFKMIRRYEMLDWRELLQSIQHNPEKALELLEGARKLGPQSEDWQAKITSDKVAVMAIQNSKWAKVDEVYHIINIITYNESPDILSNSLDSIYKSGYDPGKIIVFVSQEQRMDANHNVNVRKVVTEAGGERFLVREFQENDLELVYNQNHNLLEIIAIAKQSN